MNTFVTQGAHSVDGRRCERNVADRTKVNLVTAPMFVYWRDTAADFTTNRDGLVGDGVGRMLPVSRCSRSHVQVNVERER